MSAAILVGTCAWSDHEGFYPPGLPANRQIAYYSQHFPLVEVDSSFYAPLSRRNAALWAERTPEHFCFNVKAFRHLTLHDRTMPTPAELEAEVGGFSQALAPLVETGKLGAVHLQFAPWVTRTAEHWQYIEALREALGDVPVAIEFRHRSWFAEEHAEDTLARLAQLGAIHVVCDEPQVGTANVPRLVRVTSSALAILRLHGRNARTWYSRGPTSATRFDYRYDQTELTELAGVVKELAEKADRVHVLFNNNARDYAVRNAFEMSRILGLGYPDPFDAQDRLPF